MIESVIALIILLVYGWGMYLLGKSHTKENVKAKVSETPDVDPRKPSAESQSIPSSVDEDEPSSID